MVKKSTVIFTILALLAFGACTCWGYTVSKWPVPGIPNTVYGPDLRSCLGIIKRILTRLPCTTTGRHKMSTLTLGPSVIVRPDGIDPERTSYWWGGYPLSCPTNLWR